MMKRRTRQAGFTLIELLTVIAVIAVLASILFPTFARAREKARQSACLSNEKQVGLALQMYMSDYDTVQVISNSGVLGVADPPYWYDLLDSYLKNKSLLICPSDTEVDSGDRSSYRFAAGVFGQEESVYPEPAEAYVLGECAGGSGINTWTGQPSVGNPANGHADARQRRHNGGANYLYLDGHSKWSKEEASPF